MLNQNYSRREEYNPDYTPFPYLVTKLNPECNNRSYGIGISTGCEYTRSFAKYWMGTVRTDIGAFFIKTQIYLALKY